MATRVQSFGLFDQAGTSAVASGVVTEGNHLTLHVETRNGTDIVSVVDNLNGVPWSVARKSGANSGRRAALYYLEDTAGGEIEVTVTIAESDTLTGAVTETAGLAQSGSLDQTNESLNFSTQSHSHGGITTSNDGGITFAALALSTNLTESVAPDFDGEIDNGIRAFAQYAIHAGSITTAATTATELAGNSVGVIASFRNAGVGGASVTGSGALASPNSGVAGSGAPGGGSSGSASLGTSAAALAGIGSRVAGDVGPLVALGTSSAGLSASGVVGRRRTGSGALQTQTAALAATGSRGRRNTSVVALLSAAAQVSGAATQGSGAEERTGSGVLQVGVATLAGSGRRGADDLGPAVALSASSGSVAASGVVSSVDAITGAGALAAGLVGVGGTGARSHFGSASLPASLAQAIGVASRGVRGSGALTTPVAVINGSTVSAKAIQGSGTLVVTTAHAAATAFRGSSATGAALVAGPAYVVAERSLPPVLTLEVSGSW